MAAQDQLQAIVEKYHFFYSNSNILSQWYPVKFSDDKGRVFSSAEQYMMYQKALLFKDTETAARILRNNSPAVVKKLGRAVQNFDEEIWKKKRSAIVTKGNYLKFSQNPELKSQLITTHPKLCVEASPTDAIWGIGMSAQNAVNRILAGEVDAKGQPKNWGENLLGKALTRVRLMLLKEEQESATNGKEEVKETKKK